MNKLLKTDEADVAVVTMGSKQLNKGGLTTKKYTKSRKKIMKGRKSEGCRRHTKKTRKLENLRKKVIMEKWWAPNTRERGLYTRS